MNRLLESDSTWLEPKIERQKQSWDARISALQQPCCRIAEWARFGLPCYSCHHAGIANEPPGGYGCDDFVEKTTSDQIRADDYSE
jgi:hypothetical protein